MPDPRISVSHKPLIAVAKRLCKLATERRVRAGKLTLRYEEGHMMLEVLGGVEAVPATGHWPGTLRVSGIVLLMFVKGEFPSESTEFSYRDGYLHIRGTAAHLKYRAEWEDISPAKNLDMPLDATDTDYLRLSVHDYSPVQISATGLDKQIAACEERLQKAIDRAVPIFSKYTIARADLESAIRALILKPR